MAKLKDPDYDYDSDSEAESKSGAKLMTKLKKLYSEQIQIKMLLLLLLLWMIFFYYYCFFIVIGDYLSLLMIIIHDYLLLLMIIGYCNKTNCSGIYKEVTRPVLNFFFYDKISQALKSTKKHNQYISFFSG